jgi:chaperone modulatory protein CbpM
VRIWREADEGRIMSIDTVQAVYFDRSVTLSTAELVERSGLSEAEVRTLVECGAFAPDDPHARAWTFTFECLVVARTAHRLREQYALDDAHALAVVLRLTQRIDELQSALRRMR